MGGIGIVGTGISGAQLALYLQRRGLETTVYSPQPVEEQRAARLPNCVVRWAPTLDRERELGVFHWKDQGFAAMHVRVAADQPLTFCGRLPRPAGTTDFRIYLPRLLEDYEERGGRIVVGACGPEDLPGLAGRHDLVVVAAGRDGFGDVFERDASRSPYEHPARRICVGLYHGMAWPEPIGVQFNIIPGAGEIFQLPFHSFDGPVSGVAVFALPGEPLDSLSDMDYQEDPSAFEAALLDLLGAFAPPLYERVDRSSFGLTRPIDLLQGALTPVVRQCWAALGEERYALAIGDAWVLNDPIAAQGANLGSRCAFALGEALAAGGPYDEPFRRRVGEALWAAAAAPTALTSALLAPPPPHVIDVLARASQDQATADAFVAGFGEPEAMLARLTPEPALS